MTDVSRRMVIGGAAAIGGAVMAGDGDSYAGQPPYGPMPGSSSNCSTDCGKLPL